ncbi:MAG: pilus assembly protein PilP [Ahniella sp.]|nr:pilus assembly protein PilP [Ahniella sp.]
MNQVKPSRMPVRPVLLLATSLLVAGCVPGTRDLEQKIADIKAERGIPIEPLPPMKEYPPFAYTAHDLRDPFAQFGDDDNPSGTDGVSGPDDSRVKEPLEGFPLDALDMVGTIGDPMNSPTALITDPSGAVHRLKPGNYLGQNDGQITAVYEDRVELVELVSNGNGGWMERPASIALDDE